MSKGQQKKKRQVNWSIMFFVLLVICIILIGITVWMFRQPSKETVKTDTKKASGENIQNKTVEEENVQAEEQEKQKSEDPKVTAMLEKMTTEEKAAQLFIVTPEAITGVTKATAAGEATKEALGQYPVGGLIYFTKNLTSPEQTQNMLSNTKKYSLEVSKLPVFTCVDEEGGTVARIGNDPDFSVPKIENMSEIGAAKDKKRAREVGTIIGGYLSELGFNLDFAPDADVLSNPNNTVVKERSFGSDCSVVAEMAGEVLAGLQEKNVWGVLKHFPGHGATEGDTHEGYAYTNKTLDQLLTNEMYPFAKADEMGAKFVMAAHISAPQIVGDDTPSSLSKAMLTDILRGKIGYQGIIITDALDMEAVKKVYSSADAAVKAFTAGADMLLMPEDFKEAYQGILNAVQDGTITKERLDESVSRIIKVKLGI